MTTSTSLVELQAKAVKVIHHALSVYNCKYGTRHAMPVVKFSNRTTRSAGICRAKRQFGKVIDCWIIISNKHLAKYPKQMLEDVCIHELGHYVDNLIRNHSGHDQAWKNECIKLGLKNPTQYHTLSLDVADRNVSAERYNKLRSYIGKTFKGKYVVVGLDLTKRVWCLDLAEIGGDMKVCAVTRMKDIDFNEKRRSM